MVMDSGAHQKVRTAHLSRLAYLYVRQSTLRQLFENTESTHRQYALRERAVALGWPLDRIIVIDSDLGQSGASAADREGFQRLVTEVSLGRVGIVLGLEVSRLARNSTDWHRLLELCALAAAQEAYEKAKAADGNIVTDAERAELMALATDFPRLWRDPRTQMKEKKRMLRLLIEDVTLTKGDALHVDIRFVGGATRSLDLPLPKSCMELRTTDAEVVKEIDRLVSPIGVRACLPRVF